MKTVFQIILSLGIGILIGYFLGCNGKIKEITKEKVVIKTDTLIKEVKIWIPEKKVVYLSKTDTLLSKVTDSVFIKIIEEQPGLISTNVYLDTITDEKFNFEYEIQTFGELLSFKPKITIYPETETITRFIKPKWTISGGISNRLNYKLGLGFKGWIVEGEFKNNFQQVYLTKQFNF